MAKKKTKWMWTGDSLVEETSDYTPDEYYDDLGWEKAYERDEDKLTNKTKEFDWTDYNASGKWKGYSYYKPSTLTYSYICQMANAIASEKNVNVKIGKTWGIDLKTKTLIYNPTDMMFSTKYELLATLLHEVGKISMSTEFEKIAGKSIKRYKHVAYDVISIYDDFRIDDTMINAYPTAPEIYESQSGLLDKIVGNYIEAGRLFRDVKRSIMDQHSKRLNDLMTKHNGEFWVKNGKNLEVGDMVKIVKDGTEEVPYLDTPEGYEGEVVRANVEGLTLESNAPAIPRNLWADLVIRGHTDGIAYSVNSRFVSLVSKPKTPPQPPYPFERAYEDVFGHKPKGKVRTLDDFNQYIFNEFHVSKPNIFDFEAAVIHQGYGLFPNPQVRADMIQRFKDTSAAVPQAVSADSTQMVNDVLEVEVFPKIKDLLEETKKGSELMQEALGEAVAEAIMDKINQELQAKLESQKKALNTKNGEQNVRNDNTMCGEQTDLPREWQEGDYTSLHDSVKDEIRSLYAKMTKLRRKERTMKFEAHQRRGKINTRSLYGFATGNTRLFKRKMENVDTIRSFAFSILADWSGSMGGDRTIHTTRGLIMLAEVFTKLGMPFEVIHFESHPHVTKTFDEAYTKDVKKKLAGYANGSGGGTYLSEAIPHSTLLKREEMNKVMVILTDGGVDDGAETEIQKLMDKGVQVIPIGLECGDEATKMAGGTGLTIDTSSKMPQVFYDVLAKTIFKRKI